MYSPQYTKEEVTFIQQWTDRLFTFKITRSNGYNFKPGQYASLGFKKEGTMFWRAYSIASSPYAEELAFHFVNVEGGAFTSKLSHLEVGDNIYIDKQSYGILTTDSFQSGKDLWLICSSTGIAPFISILQDIELWTQFEKVIILHSVKFAKELIYQQTINDLKTDDYYRDLICSKIEYIKIVSQENAGGNFYGRVTNLLRDNQLENSLDLSINKSSRVMLCGSKTMVADTRDILLERGLTLMSPDKSGNIVCELQ